MSTPDRFDYLASDRPTQVRMKAAEFMTEFLDAMRNGEFEYCYPEPLHPEWYKWRIRRHGAEEGGLCLIPTDKSKRAW